MAETLTKFRIEGLHGQSRAIDIPIENNRLVLVGENGSGKSTVANLLYYLLTQQWRRINDYKIDALQVSASGEWLQFSHDDIDILAERQRGPFRAVGRFFPPRLGREAYEFLISAHLEDLPEDVIVEQLTEHVSVPKTLARRLVQEYMHTEGERLSKSLIERTKRLSNWDFGQFLYLPTYRRIEQDLKSIFRGIEIEEKVKEFRQRFRKRDKSTYIELVEFGMEDVEKTIQSRMDQIKENVRTGLSTLTGTYLREVIRGLQDSPDVSVLRSIEPTAFQSMFERIEDSILPPSDKKLLQSKIAEISKGDTIGPDDKVIAHFLSKLVTLYKEQQESESDVRDFVRLCNAYLTRKQLVYDDIKYEIYIAQTTENVQTKSTETVELKDLSSGEKQIVSLFSHLYLSGERNFFIVIDEPELSLSVPWQQRFLPDILETGRCTGIVAVTHSPFIWDNKLEPYVRSLAEFQHVLH